MCMYLLREQFLLFSDTLHLFAFIVCLHQLLPCLYARKTEHNTDHG